ncbi:hypothetical protein BC831DRAFT_428664 [Entophlyctis helioformis]|nr:hypothetical protein BC831DRAFT_428664 [Entophlyctis helioformis]
MHRLLVGSLAAFAAPPVPGPLVHTHTQPHEHTYTHTNELLYSRRALLRLRSSAAPSLAAADWVVLPSAARSQHAEHPQFWAIESVCPHSGGPLHLGDIEDLIPDDAPSPSPSPSPTTTSATSATSGPLAIVCPWHEYRFSLSDGSCSTVDLFRAETAQVVVDEHGSVVLLHPSLDTVESVRFFDVKPTRYAPSTQQAATQDPSGLETATSALLAATLDAPPSILTDPQAGCVSLVDYAIAILNTPDPSKKVALTRHVADLWNAGKIDLVQSTLGTAPPDEPLRDPSLNFIQPGRGKRLGKGGSLESRIAILHSLANIEQWAIDLAWDIIARFASVTVVDPTTGETHGLPRAFFTDFVRVASEEARHFTFLVEQLDAAGSHFGALSVHGGLWESATVTQHDLGARLAIVHMVHEARGLDVNPKTIEKFAQAGDTVSVEKLTKIHDDEITHVATGQRWFSWLCAIRGDDRYSTFHDLVRKYFHGPLKPPFNDQDRLTAGLDAKYYMPLTVKRQ